MRRCIFPQEIVNLSGAAESEMPYESGAVKENEAELTHPEVRRKLNRCVVVGGELPTQESPRSLVHLCVKHRKKEKSFSTISTGEGRRKRRCERVKAGEVGEVGGLEEKC